MKIRKEIVLLTDEPTCGKCHYNNLECPDGADSSSRLCDEIDDLLDEDEALIFVEDTNEN